MNRCDPRSVFAAVLTASQFGWEIGTHAYLVPYDNTKTNTTECQLVPGWQGLVDLASRSGRAVAWTGAVYEGDEFDYGLGDSPFIHHKPLAVEETVEKLTHVYAVGRVTGAQWPVVEVWPIAKVRAHRDRYNRQGQKHYSYQHIEMYGRKVALLQVLKYLPKSVEMQTAIQLEYDAETGEQQKYTTTTEVAETEWIQPPAQPEILPAPEEKKTTTEEIKDELKKKPKPTDPEQGDVWPKKEKKADEKLPF